MDEFNRFKVRSVVHLIKKPKNEKLGVFSFQKEISMSKRIARVGMDHVRGNISASKPLNETSVFCYMPDCLIQVKLVIS
eukprot:CAMPEP_0194063498 /NCGR_PEP_ID=MMETSP0009_2-20130614/80500_1 /TAXON_ID=210454 /ORGANISM="Grammatophora oceanica, Strain CCMP 410" /LENGTH=78 /DNA_ID=CAMNT_0038715637 /DNA_START=249 /DNA_END=482 /DNA_ORIENTATION=-